MSAERATSPTPGEPRQLLDSIRELVQGIVRRKSGMTLASGDGRADNEDARDLVNDVLEKVWLRISQSGSDVRSIADIRAYAATVAHNEWSDYLRRRHPKRASLKNRLRYFLNHQPAYAVWPDPQGGLVAGLKEHVQARLGDASERLASIRTGELPIDPRAVPPKGFERFDAHDWDRLLRAIFACTTGPAPLDELVGTVAALVDLQEDSEESLDDTPDDDPDGAPRDIEDTEGATPHQLIEIRDTLRHVWTAIVGLRRDYRLAYLLNLPGPGKLRSDIGVFIVHGVATLEEIGQAIGLTHEEHDRMFSVLDPGSEADDTRGDPDPQRRFDAVFALLPISDEAIGAVLCCPKQTVINRRKQALEILQRALADRPRGRRPGVS